jgi:dihydrofolate synthase/folylpolyglutamate synthase
MPSLDAAYRAVLDDLFRRRRFGVKLDLLAPRRALEALGDPAVEVPVVHIGGTNAKGSTAAMAEAILRADGRRTGLYTSPHLHRFTERIRVSGAELDRAEVIEHYRRVTEVAPTLTFFEVTTLLAALAFAAHQVEVAVIEVGLGGRLDATNLFTAAVTGLGPVGREHTAYLGQNLERIAWEKGGLLRPRVPAATTACSDETVARVLRRLAEVKGTPLYELGRDFHLDRDPAGGSPGYRGPGGDLLLPPLPLLGAHQEENAALALALTGLLPATLRPSSAARRAGLASVSWPGRMERLPGPPAVLLDCGHNPQAVETLLTALRSVPRRRTIVVLAAMADKELGTIVPALVAVADQAIVTAVAYYRGADPALLVRHVPEAWRSRVETAPDVPAALARARELAGPDDLILVAGSVFLVGEARAALLGEPGDPVKVTDPVAVR